MKTKDQNGIVDVGASLFKNVKKLIAYECILNKIKRTSHRVCVPHISSGTEQKMHNVVFKKEDK